MSRRNLISDELGKASMDAIKRLPSFAPMIGFAFKQSAAQKEEEKVKNLWLLLMGREPKDQEAVAALEGLRKARSPEEKGDSLVDLLWALCQTVEFETVARGNSALIRGLYLIALDRQPTEEERAAALEVLSETEDLVARGAALEGLLTGLFRSGDSIFRKEPFVGVKSAPKRFPWG